MNAASFFLLAATLSLAIQGALALSDNQPNGKYETRDGSVCVWFELRKSDRGAVFVTACHCKDAEGHKQSYSCEYNGPIEECDTYQSDPKGFYNMVAAHLQGKFSQ